MIDGLDLHDALLVGSSFGGWVALEMAVRSEARLGRLVLIDALGVKVGGRAERDIAALYALPADGGLRPHFVDPARIGPHYANPDHPQALAIPRDREATPLYPREPHQPD